MKLSCQWTQFLPHTISFSLWFCYSKKVSKKQGYFNPWPSHICWSSLHPPPSAKHVSCFGHSVQLPTVWKSVFSKIGRLFAESYLCSRTSDRPNKICLKTAFRSCFLIFYDFLNLNQDFRARCHIFETKCPTDKITYSLVTLFLSRFFIFYYFLSLN